MGKVELSEVVRRFEALKRLRDMLSSVGQRVITQAEAIPVVVDPDGLDISMELDPRHVYDALRKEAEAALDWFHAAGIDPELALPPVPGAEPSTQPQPNRRRT
jgi:hypothetical protein